MDPRGIWYLQHRIVKLQNEKPILTRLSESISWETFRHFLDKGHSQELEENACRKEINLLILFKMLLLQ